ncbi:MAG: aminotransferase class V-fold PLP-dependent enzyme [Lewinellaceae bacterium]|nr:aminotransferase class V-fold PLP-dependent enzyme [Saprospiraceae bacterium]MCB9311699.1 aminotransferase class V-fold PLP-dependent enzyme [Lewinellaceae bacterium]
MKPDRRQFIQNAAGGLGALSIGSWLDTATKQSLLGEIRNTLLANPGPEDEDFWALIRQAYTVSPQIINLNNGGVSPQPAVVQDAMVRFYHQANEGPSYYMWQVLDQGREPLRRRLAELAGCDPEEVAMNRNASEALETAIYGIDLDKGDEVVLSKQDYPNMINAWKQREQREGIVLKWVNHQLPTEDSDLLVKGYTDLFTSRTRVVHITHIINWNGQVLPARAIADQARKKNILVVIDGAHSFAHLDYSVPDLGGDYFGTSLHKWLSAPFGSGFLWVKKERIAETWPLFASQEPRSEDIRKFEALGTRSFPIEHAVGEAIDFQLLIGNRRKQKRLWYLKNYWTSQVQDLPGVSIGTPVSSDWSGAIALLQIEGKEPSEISQALWKDHKIHTVAIVWENIKGVRITPHVYTSLRDLDLLVKAIRQIAST